MSERAASAARRAEFAVLALLAASILVFLWKPLASLSTHAYTSADLTQDYSLTALGEHHDAGNRLLSDPALEMRPWALYNRARLADGSLPFWNPWNGAGVPHLANWQSGVFSIFNLPYYLCPLPFALWCSAAATLAALAFFTYRFLRLIDCARLAAAIGALAFTFAGENVVLLAYPHAGVIATLPASLYFLERALQALETMRRRSAVASALAGLGLTWTIGAYAGHPEPLAFTVMANGAWALTRSFGIARKLGGFARSARKLGGFALAVIATGVLALALAAPQIAPFLEYLSRSVTSTHREPVVQPSIADAWPLSFFPRALGSPQAGWTIAADLPAPNFEQVSGSYVGALVLVAAALGLARVANDRRARCFAAAAAVWLAFTTDACGLGRAYDGWHALSNYAPLARSQPLWSLSLAALAALALDRMLRREKPAAWPVAVGAPLAACAVFAAAWLRARDLTAAAILRAPSAERAGVLANIRGDEWWLAASFVIGVSLIGVLLRARSARVRSAGAVMFGAALFAQIACVWLDYNPTVEQRFVYPRTESIRRLQDIVGDDTVALLTDNGLPPDTNLVYGLHTLQNYDALDVQRFQTLALLGFGARGTWHDLQFASPNALETFGVRWVVTAGDWVPVDTAFGARLLERDSRYQPIALARDVTVSQSFESQRDDLTRVAFWVSTERSSKYGKSDLRARLFADDGRLVAEHFFDARELRTDITEKHELAFSWDPFAVPGDWRGKFAVLEFEPAAYSRGRRFHLVLDSTSNDPGDRTLVWCSDVEELRAGTLNVNRVWRPETLLFDYGWGPRRFQPVARLGGLVVHRFIDGLGRYFSVPSALFARSQKQALQQLRNPLVDPYRVVVVEPDPDHDGPEPSVRGLALEPQGADCVDDGDSAQPSDLRLWRAANLPRQARAVDCLECTPERVHLRVESREPRWLVACQTYYPGWTAKVNGVDTALECANFAFCAVQVPAGTSEVVLEYRPRSFELGLVIAGTAAVLGALLWWSSTRRA